ncbi:hypothetical protein PYCC9005_000398 [Savitreella phatthalungensis]
MSNDSEPHTTTQSESQLETHADAHNTSSNSEAAVAIAPSTEQVIPPRTDPSPSDSVSDSDNDTSEPTEESIKEAEINEILTLQKELLDHLDQMDTVQSRIEKLSNEKRFLEDYIGNLVSMQQTGKRR